MNKALKIAAITGGVGAAITAAVLICKKICKEIRRKAVMDFLEEVAPYPEEDDDDD